MCSGSARKERAKKKWVRTFITQVHNQQQLTRTLEQKTPICVWLTAKEVWGA
jgi:hypothetical protein